jgi:hypothetical protein
MDRLNFTGIQNTDKGDTKVKGYIQILPKEDEFRFKIRGLISIYGRKNLNYNFTGSITQLLLDMPPQTTLFTSGNLGEKLYYKFEDSKFVSDKLIYSGIWCYLTPENINAIARLFPPKASKEVSLEFVLKKEDRLLLKKIGISE